MFVAEGFQNVSIRKIAERIEYAPSTIYLYFKDKDEIMLSLCEETFETLMTEIKSVTSAAKDPLSALKCGLRSYIQFGLAHPSHYLISFCLPPPKSKIEWKLETSIGLQTFDLLRQSIRKCMECGAIRQQDVEVASQLAWTSAHGVTSLLISSHDMFPFVDHKILIDAVLDNIVNGLK